MRSIRLHGQGGDKYDIVRTGVNGRLDTMQAAILIEKLKIFPDEIRSRNEVAERYSIALAGHAKVPALARGTTSVWAQYTLTIPDGRRDGVMKALKAEGIPTQVYYPRPLPSQPAYQRYPICSGGVPISELLPGSVLSLPMHAYLSEHAQQRIVSTITGIRSARKADGTWPTRQVECNRGLLGGTSSA